MLNLWVASCQGTRMVILSGTARPWNIIYLPRFCVPRYFILSLRCIAFRICKACYMENSFCPKTTLSGVKKMHSSEFGRSWRPNRSQQVNFWGTLKTYGHNASNELCGRSVASKLIPQQAGGLFHQGDTEIGENLHFFIKRSTPENFQCDNFPGGGPMELLGDHASEYV